MKKLSKPTKQSYCEYLDSLNFSEVDSLFYKTFAEYKYKADLYKAYELMKQNHAGQLRRDEKTPYFIHLARIALTMYVSFRISNKEMLIAGLFHDLVEDTKITLVEIESNWGNKVASLVAVLTNPKIDDKTESIRFAVRQRKWNKMQKASRAARQLWFFDNYDNISDYNSIKEGSKNYFKRPRWLGQAKKFYLPNAKFLGVKYYTAIKKIYDKILSEGIKPQIKNFINR